MKIKFNIDIFICLLIAIVTKNIEKYAVFMLFIIIHEMAHLVTGIVLGVKPKRIDVYALGLSLEFYSFGHITYKNLRRILIYIAGPLINFAIAIVLIILNDKTYLDIIYINLILGFFNLLPIYPMDGGRILKQLLTIVKGEKASKIITNKVSNIAVAVITVCYSILILYVHNFAIFMVIIYLWIILIKENKNLKLQLKMYEVLEREIKRETKAM